MDFKINLSQNWRIQSSKKCLEIGSRISTVLDISKDWIPAIVPSTVLGTLVSNKIYKDPYFGKNLNAISTEKFKDPWWYVTNFNLSPKQASKLAILNFDGINYKANVWLNGKLIANTNDINGAFRITKFNVSQHIVSENNILAIEVIPPKPGDFSTGFVDWNPAPPDGNMGIFRPVICYQRSSKINNYIIPR